MAVSVFEKIDSTLQFHYYRRRNNWIFPSNMAHTSGAKMARGNYEPVVSEIVEQYLDDGGIFLDVGANVGYFSRLAADLVGSEGRVFAFEADLENYYALSRNIKDYPQAIALRFAVSDDNSIIELNHSTHSSCHSLVDTGNYLSGQKYSIPSITLDYFWSSYLEEKPIDLLKIDVEGAEMMVLNGMDRLLSEKMISTMIIEFCPAIMKNAGYAVDDFYRKIASEFEISIIEEEFKEVVGNGAIDDISDFQAVANRLLEKGAAENINLLCLRK